MSDSHTSELDALLRQLDEVTQPEVPVEPARLLVATDWSDAAPALTLLKAFRAIVPDEAPVTLVFAVPHEPTEADARCIQVLAEGADPSGSLAGLDIVSFEDAAGRAYDAAVVPTGHAGELLSQVGGLIVRMHDLVRRDERRARSGIGDSTVNAADASALSRRLASFAA